MSRDVEMKRQAVMGAYHSFAWQDKVLKMSDRQVVAIFLRLKAQGKL